MPSKRKSFKKIISEDHSRRGARALYDSGGSRASRNSSGRCLICGRVLQTNREIHCRLCEGCLTKQKRLA